MKLRKIAILLGAALFLVVAAWQSVVTIDNGQRGIVERYGRPVRDLLPGLHVKLPVGMERVRTVPGPERSLPMPIGYRLIDEKLGKAPPGPMKEWLTGDSNIVEIKADVLYSIRDPRKYLYGVSNVTDLDPYSIEPRSQDFVLRRIAEAALTEIIGKLPVTQVITGGAATIAIAAEERIQRDADALGLGVEIVRFQLLESLPLASTKGAFREVQDAKAERDRGRSLAETSALELLSRAQSAATRQRREARTSAERRVLEAQSKADQFLDLHEAVGDAHSPAGIALQRKRMQQLLKLTHKQVVPATAEKPAVVYTDR